LSVGSKPLNMQQFVRYFIVLLVLFCSCSQKKEKDKITFLQIPPFYLKASIDSTATCDSTNCYYVTASLENKTLQTLPYYSWTCSWTGDFVTDNKNFEVKQNICFSNWYYIDSIPPLGSNTFHLVIRKIGRQQIDSFKIGFTFIDPGLVPADKFLHLTQTERLKNVSWSYPISTVR
jgi:hypothetical protein